MIKITHIPFLLLITSFLSAQTITIHFDNALGSTPSVFKAPLKYNKDFAYSLTLDDATSDAFTHVFPLLQGGTLSEFESPFPGLYYTDGCGNDIAFKAGIAWNTANAFNMDIHNGDIPGILTWQQLDTLYKYGWDVFNHSYSHKSNFTAQMSPQDYINEIVNNQNAVREKTAKHIEMPVFVVPSGDVKYQDNALQLGHKVVFDQAGPNLVGVGGLQVDLDLNLYGLKIHRQIIEESILSTSFLDNIAVKSLNVGRFWYNEFAHRTDNFSNGSFNFYAFKNQMQKIADFWGKKGADRVLMAPLQEVFEYLVLRQTVKMTTSITGQKMQISFDLSEMPSWLRRKTLTLVINSTSNFSQVDVPNTIKKTFKGTGNQKLINIDFSEYSPSTSTKEIVTPSVLYIFPNPAGDILNVEIVNQLSEKANLTISDTSGKVYFTSKISLRKFQQNIQSLPKGAYILTVQQGKYLSSEKFIKN